MNFSDIQVNSLLIEKLTKEACSTYIGGQRYATPSAVADALVYLLKSIVGEISDAQMNLRKEYEKVQEMKNGTEVMELLQLMSTAEYPVTTVAEAKAKYTELRQILNSKSAEEPKPKRKYTRREQK
jgi:hypothetical protein